MYAVLDIISALFATLCVLGAIYVRSEISESGDTYSAWELIIDIIIMCNFVNVVILTL